MTSTSADRVALILDCLGNLDTDISGQTRLWRHADGRYVTEDEAAMIDGSTLGELSHALDLWRESVKHLREMAELSAEFDAIISPHKTGSSDTARDVMTRMPAAKIDRAIEIWNRVGPFYEAWKRDQS